MNLANTLMPILKASVATPQRKVIISSVYNEYYRLQVQQLLQPFYMQSDRRMLEMKSV